MTLTLIEISIVLVGLAVTGILFYRFPRLPEIKDEDKKFPVVSIIIPVRNEENNLSLLLNDLSRQTLPVCEIICVDDGSEDATAQVVRSWGAKLISAHNKPNGWLGKSWACKRGADVAKGEVFLFLDADVRLERNGLRKLVQAFSELGCTISVQPYHKTVKLYEQFSLIFNLVQTAANGAALPKPSGVGLYGPIIMIARSDYNQIGGHERVRRIIVEDMALGQQLKQADLPFRLFVGEEDISYRMYGDGFRSLLQGWIKNMAAGAARTSLPVLIMTFLWITSLASVPLQIVKFAVRGNVLWFSIYVLLYLVWVVVLRQLSKRVGEFRPLAIVLYPLLLIVFIGVFAVSMFKKLFGLKVTWKGRSINTEGRPCE
ncbi:MAG: glycosyltransferase family 2 protein [Clostridiaceae bacterium]|nr:glycosyltransferase family 2 protein [Clostridiaceae bacterium]